MYSPINYTALYQPTMNYYNTEADNRRMSYSDYLSSSSSSSQESFSDYENSPLTGTEEYYHVAGQPKFYYQNVYSFVQQQQQQLQQPGANLMSGYYQQYDCLIDNLMLTPLSNNSSPIIQEETIKMECGKQRINTTRAKRSNVTSKKQDEKNFPCHHDECGKVFKRSEHLKRHVRSIHTREKRKWT